MKDAVTGFMFNPPDIVTPLIVIGVAISYSFISGFIIWESS